LWWAQPVSSLHVSHLAVTPTKPSTVIRKTEIRKKCWWMQVGSWALPTLWFSDFPFS
jgi:hypothetical protein